MIDRVYFNRTRSNGDRWKDHHWAVRVGRFCVYSRKLHVALMVVCSVLVEHWFIKLKRWFRNALY